MPNCSSNTCVAVKNQDDPTACTGTCDATGACKSKQGQSCKASADCADGLPCADGYCCDKACTGTCEACDLGTAAGTCTTLGLNATPHAGHGSCTATDATCAGKCDGSSNACSYPNGQCGSPSCTGTTYQAAGKCSFGACAMPATQTCPANQTCSGSACACQSPSLTCSGACTNVQTDAKNCGSCGHDCLGGACVDGLCQPKLLADVTLSWEAASTFMISGSNLILHLGGRGTAADANAVWAVDINGSGAVGLRRSEDNSTPVVALDNRLYWVAVSGDTNQLVSCPLAGCSTASYTTVATRQMGSASSLSSDLLVADPVAHELVWRETAYSDPVYATSVVRSGAQGPARVVTSVSSRNLERWVASNNRSDRYFWSTYDSATSTSKYYYVPTNTPSASPVAITGSMASSGFPAILASDTVAFIVTYPYPSHQVFSIPLPNGVAGEPPSVYTGEAVWAAADAQYAYGQNTGAATDGVWRCLLTNCNPTYLARNFLQGSSYILVDDRVLYVLDRATGGSSFRVWKLAK